MEYHFSINSSLALGTFSLKISFHFFPGVTITASAEISTPGPVCLMAFAIPFAFSPLL